jgi:Protein of unknown function (DUF3455)
MITGKCANMATLSALALLAGCASAPAPVAPDIPATLAVPADERLAVIVEATGVQIYDCVPAKDAAAGSVWAFRAPEAELRDQAGHAFGRHYAGPTWEANDGSKIVGVVKAKENAPASDAIPWLLLTTGATYGHGVLAQTRSIQRLKTVGGQPLTPGCNADQVGREMRVPYQAEYRFYVAGS